MCNTFEDVYKEVTGSLRQYSTAMANQVKSLYHDYDIEQFEIVAIEYHSFVDSLITKISEKISRGTMEIFEKDFFFDLILADAREHLEQMHAYNRKHKIQDPRGFGIITSYFEYLADTLWANISDFNKPGYVPTPAPVQRMKNNKQVSPVQSATFLAKATKFGLNNDLLSLSQSSSSDAEKYLRFLQNAQNQLDY